MRELFSVYHALPTYLKRNIDEILVSPTPSSIIIAGFIAGGVVRGVLVGILILLVSLLFSNFLPYQRFSARISWLLGCSAFDKHFHSSELHSRAYWYQLVSP